ncbi:hypothetical protein BJX99DRAFT_132311 [Aspergillus californicus]
MAKSKRARVQHQNAPSKSISGVGAGASAGKKHRKMSSFAKLSTKNNYKDGHDIAGRGGASNGTGPAKKKNQEHQQKIHRRPIIPFRREDRILLLGEGDFSFARSLTTHHRCKNILATCYDSKEALDSKYPTAKTNIDEILASSKPKPKPKSKSNKRANEPNESETQNQSTNTNTNKAPKILFSIDAKKLGLPSGGGGKEIRAGFPKRERKIPAWKQARKDHDNSINRILKDKIEKDKGCGPWDIICFNFPHVGGLSTDVNRQVRANQELLVAVFKACVPLLAGKPDSYDEDEDEVEEDEEEGWGPDGDEDEGESEKDDGDGIVKAKDEWRTESGQILVTLFEGEPYTLWNIRDLARYSGLRVVTSFKFPWTCYPGYSHARTLGDIERKDGERGGWRGEDREARMYVFEVKTDDKSSTTGKKRSAEPDDSDSD